MAEKTAVSFLSAAELRRLRRLATAKDARGYAAWLRGEKTDGGENAALLEAAKRADRTAVGYGTSGDALSSSALADDGYAAYLRLAAKEARERERRALEGSRAAGEAALLRGYADYLKKEKAAAGDRLVSAATALSKGPREKAEAETLIASSGAEGEAAAALRALWQAPEEKEESSPSPSLPVEETISYIVKAQMPSERALEYCRLLGFDDETAKSIVKFAEQQRSENTDRLHGILGH